MDYRVLAEELIGIRHLSSSMTTEREVSKVVDGCPYVLSRLFEEGEGAYPKQLREDMGVSTARIAAILNQLEERGYITREEDPDDSRHVIVRLTNAGADKACEQHDALVNYYASALQALGPDDAREYVRLHSKVTTAMADSVRQLEIGVSA